MDFEEQFPSLKGKILTVMHFGEGGRAFYQDVKFVDHPSIQKFCLDKERVRKAILENKDNGGRVYAFVLLEELGL